MKSVDAAVSTAIRQAYNVYCKPRLTVEWNLNRYASPSAGNMAPETNYGFNVEMFPIESLYAPNRPTKGINKARVGQATVSEYSETPFSARYYVAGKNDTYKYWTSPVPSSGTTFPLYNQTFATTYGITDAGDGLTVARPYVTYGSVVQSNKIVIGLENSFSSPATYQVLTRSTVGGAWTEVASNPTINSAGQIVLWRQSGGTWSTTAPVAGTTAPLTDIAGVMLKVDTMTVADTFLNVIEISARRQEDLTDRLISTESTQDLSEPSVIYPLGTITSNTANLSLSNIDSIFDQDNTSSTYAGILEPNAKFTLEYVYTINGTQYVVPEFVMFGGPWSGQKDEVVSMECMDFSKYFQELTPRPTFYQDLSVSEIIYRLCDQVGFVDYVVTIDPATPQPKIAHFWANGEQTIWEVFDELSKATQTAIYFDSYGKLRVKTRTKAFNESASPVWRLKGSVDAAAPTELPDIISLDQTDELGTNHITVNYQTTEFPETETGFPVRETVWQPEGDVVLRASPLTASITSSSMTLNLPPKEAELWPYSGYLQIEGEIIKYEGKTYVAANGVGGALTTQVIKSLEEKKNLDTATPSQKRYQNHFTGKLTVVERGAWNSEAKDHLVEATGYSVRNIIDGTRRVGVGGFSQNKNESTVTLKSTANITSGNDYLFATRGSTVDTGFQYYGTRLRFNAGSNSQRAGIVFYSNDNTEDGYYIEVQTTAQVDRSAKNEIMLFTRKNGSNKYLGKGAAKHVISGRFYDLDVRITTGHVITVYWNGHKAFTFDVAAGDQNPKGGKFGMFLRGSTNVSYEYLYAINRLDREMLDESTWYDRLRGAYTSSQWDKEWVYDWRATTRRQRTQTGLEQRRWNQMFMDEFGPIAHEIRDYDVKFEPNPVLDSRLFNSNEQVVCLDYIGDSFGATFTLANATRKNAVVNGEDTLTISGSGDSIERTLFVYARVAKVDESEKVEVKNDAQIAARGKIESEITSQWIQSKDAAQAIADWISSHWSVGADVQTVTIFGNPMLELTDVVDVYFPDRNMLPATHKYFVTGISSTFDSGLETTVTLRRVT